MLLKSYSNLKLYSVIPEYLLAMKLMASRMDSETDKKDIIFLMKYLGINTIEKANQVIDSAFKAEFILPKTRYVIEECLEEILEEKENNDQVETNITGTKPAISKNNIS